MSPLWFLSPLWFPSIDNPYDHDRDGTVGVLDYSAALRNLGRTLAWVPPPPALAPQRTAGAIAASRIVPARRSLLADGAAPAPLR